MSEPESPPEAFKAIPAALTAIEGRNAAFERWLASPDAQALEQRWDAFVTEPPAWFTDLQAIAADLLVGVVTLAAEIGKVVAPWGPALAEVTRIDAECQAIEAAGWLPHYTTPADVVAEAAARGETVGALLERHYTDNWPAVKAAFLRQLDGCDIDAEAQATFAEAVQAHEAGLYRTVALTLFPEIERIARQKLHAGSMEKIAGQRPLRTAAEHLPLSAASPGGLYVMHLFEKLIDHLYAKTETLEELAEVAADPVPNRHASLHGHLAYATRNSSSNALIMTDFTFQIICAVKRHAANDSGEANVPAQPELEPAG